MTRSVTGGGSLNRQTADLATRFGLPASAAESLAALLSLLTEDPLAPTTIRDPGRALRDHVADALVALELPEVREAGTIADLGAGAGVPGLPLAIARPQATVFLVESNRRKCAFIARAIAATGATNAVVVPERAESWSDGLGRCDVVTVRALAALPTVAEYAAPLLRDGGALIAWRGRQDPDEEAAAAAAATELGLWYEAPVPVRPHPDAAHRHLQRLVKISPTPARFPRRPGMARKRPLGSLRAKGI
ncbi:MAG: 16S rRNA (guanine(527)-N(7))-methyltransferase RsmG [Actinomycetota bacterium]|nr:16S rRNA (guanine(527)-N(7))-methyltransferase RsmG [Actinomycetota bacterium]